MGELVTAAIHDIHVQITLILTEDDLVADRVEAAGVRADTGTPLTWVENHIYRVADGQIEFADETAHQAHGASAAVRKFEEACQPELAAGPVVFTDYLQIASN